MIQVAIWWDISTGLPSPVTRNDTSMNFSVSHHVIARTS